MVQNYNTLTKALKIFTDNHLGLKRFKCSFFEELDNFSSSDNSFPILYAIPSDVSFKDNIDEFTFRIYCVDILQKDRSNESNILNDTLLILRDLTNWMRLSAENDLNILNEPNATPVNNFLVDFTTGWYIDITIESTPETSDCSIPFTDEFVFPNLGCSGSPVIAPFAKVIDGLNINSPIILDKYESYTCIPSDIINVSNSNDSYNVDTMVDLDLPNIIFTDSDGSTASVPSMEDIVATPLPTKSGIRYNRPMYTGQQNSAAVGDDGWHFQNGTYDYTPPINPVSIATIDPASDKSFFMLLENNAFGNKERFTDINGLQVYGDDYVIDHLTGLAIYRIDIAADIWENQILAAINSTQNGYSDWRMSNIYEVLSLTTYSNTFPYYSFSPLDTDISCWTSTSRKDGFFSTYAVTPYQPNGAISTGPKSGARVFQLMRNHYN